MQQVLGDLSPVPCAVFLTVNLMYFFPERYKKIANDFNRKPPATAVNLTALTYIRVTLAAFGLTTEAD